MIALRWVVAPNPSEMTLDGTWTYVVGRRAPVVIDPGPAEPSHISRVLELLGGIAPIAILLTHGHADHAGAAPELAERTRSSIRIGSGTDAADIPGAVPIADGETLQTDAGTLHILSTPGHTPEHICVVWPADPGAPAGSAFVGDLFVGQGDSTYVGFPEGNVADYLGSLSRVEALMLDRLYPAHGGWLSNPAQGIARFRQHRLDRVRQLARVLERDPLADVGRLIDIIYGTELSPRLRFAAGASLLAMKVHLEKD